MTQDVERACTATAAALDDLHAADLHAAGDRPALVERLVALQRRFDAVVLESLRAFDAHQDWQRDGAASAAAWLRANVRMTPGAARQAIRTAIEEASSDDVILIAGKGHETDMTIGAETVHFSDPEEALRILRPTS